MRVKFAVFLLLGLLIMVLNCGERRACHYIEQLKSGDKETRIDASYQLLLMGKSAVEPLIQVMRSGDERSRFIAIQLLGKIGDSRAVEPLIDALVGESLPLKAAEALGVLRYIAAEDALIEALQDTSAEVRVKALAALECFWDSRLNPLFVKMTEDPDDEVRYVAVQILRHTRFPGALRQLIKLLNDEVPAVRQEAAYALGEIGDKRAVRPLLNMLVEYKDEADRKAAQTALKKLTGAEYKVLE
ncbi:hypothetical protein B5M50_04900 [candidate division KSB1 bacterium 4484_219]|nr:MAG: hypothetical protein B5M50_04900 [candidate division KSB1 bacterium 4484_219]